MKNKKQYKRMIDMPDFNIYSLIDLRKRFIGTKVWNLSKTEQGMITNIYCDKHYYDIGYIFDIEIKFRENIVIKKSANTIKWLDDGSLQV